MLVFIPELLLIVAVLCFLAATIFQKVSEHTVTNISRVYLQEMTAQLGSHFQTNLDSQFSQIRTITKAISERDLEDEESLKQFLVQAQTDNAFAHIAFISSQGIVYAPEGTMPAMSKISGLDRSPIILRRVVAVRFSIAAIGFSTPYAYCFGSVI